MNRLVRRLAIVLKPNVYCCQERDRLLFGAWRRWHLQLVLSNVVLKLSCDDQNHSLQEVCPSVKASSGSRRVAGDVCRLRTNPPAVGHPTRSISALRRLKTYLRSTETGLSGLALLHLHIYIHTHVCNEGIHV